VKSLLIKGMPDRWHQRLKKMAQTHRRSLNQEAMSILGAALDPYKVPNPPRTYRFSKNVADECVVHAVHEGRD
jgi:plasmid stability protein